MCEIGWRMYRIVLTQSTSNNSVAAAAPSRTRSCAAVSRCRSKQMWLQNHLKCSSLWSQCRTVRALNSQFSQNSQNPQPKKD